MENKQRSLTTSQKMSRGTGWISIASVTSRVIGILYVIPWLALFGASRNEANGLFTIGYQYYSLFLIIATAGIPSALSKEMAFYTTRNEFRTSLKIFRVAFTIMCVLGILAGGVLWGLAPFFAKHSPVNHPEDAVIVIRSLVPALISLPFLSIMRGFFESFQDMKPSALSQIFEQIARVLFILLATYFSLRVFNKSLVFAVSISTFAAFIGSIGAIGLLAFYFFKKKDVLIQLRATSKESKVNMKQVFQTIVLTALPFVITSSGTTLMQLIDTNTFKPLMLRFSHLSLTEITNQYAIFSGNINKLIMIVISFSVAIGQTQVPVLSEAFSTGDRSKQREIIRNNLHMFGAIMVPSVVGMAIVAGPLYTIFYGADPLGTFFLQISCVMAFVLGLYFVLYTSLQALDLHKAAIIGLFIGIVVKLLLQSPLLALFGTIGALFSTTVAFLCTNSVYLYILKKKNLVSILQVVKDSKFVVLNTSVMAIGSLGVFFWFSSLFNVQNRTVSLFTVLIIALVGGALYLLLGIKNGVLHAIMGTDFLLKKKRGNRK